VSADERGLTPDRVPRGLPSGTSLSFAVLVLLALSTAAMIYSGLFYVYFHPDVKALTFCLHAVPALETPGQAIGQLGALGSHMPCVVPSSARLLGGVWGAMGALIVVAFTLFLAQPWWEIRYRRLRGLDPLTTPDLSGCLQELAGIAGLSQAPAFFIDPANPFQRAHVFGTFRRQHVCLDAGLLPLLSTDAAAFRGVVLHELAHLRNHDVPVTYLAIAVWRAFVVMALVPLVAGLVDPALLTGGPAAFQVQPLLSEGWRVAALVVLTYLTRNAVLRLREFHADVRAGSWQQTPDYLALLRGARLPRRWPGWALTHPRPHQRAQALDDPRRLYRPSFWSLAAAGIALTLTVRHLAIPLSLILVRHHLAFSVIMWFVFDAPVAGLVVVATWRAVIFSRTQGRSFAAILVPGAGLGAGLIVGYMIDLTSFSTSPGLLSSPETIGAALALPVVTVLAGVWAACCAQARLDRAPVGSLLWPLAVTAVGATILLAVYAGWWAGPGWPTGLDLAVGIGGQVRSFAAGLGWGPFGWLPVAIAYHPLSILDLIDVDLDKGFLVAQVTAVLVWLVPLGLLYFRAPYRRVVESAATGVVSLALLALILRVAVSAFAPTAAHQATAFPLVLSAQDICLALVAQAVAAAAVSATVRTHAAVLGLLTGYLTGAAVVAVLAVAFAAPFGTTSDLILARGTYASAVGIAAGWVLTRTPWATRRQRMRAPLIVAAGAALTAAVVLAAAAGVGAPARTTQPAAHASGPFLGPASTGFPFAAWFWGGAYQHWPALQEAVVRTVEDGPELSFVADPSAALAACALVDNVADAATRIPVIPQQADQRLWSGGISRIRRAAVGCVASAIGSSGAPTHEEMVIELHTGVLQLGSVLARITSTSQQALNPP
jgi:hypothetical protein